MRVRIGHYELLDLYATGGVAEIYRARNVQTGEIVIIKRIRPGIDFDPEQHAGFLRELQIALMCTHKNLIRGFDKGTSNGMDYGVLEYVDGQDLQRIAERARRSNVALPYAFVTFIVGEILEGLEFAWSIKDPTGQELGLVHRDLSPKNVFIRYDGKVRIGDFGSSLASKIEPAETVVGTLGYMSPEQARGDKLDQRSDIYAVGIVLYELVVGQPAFLVAGKTDAAALKMHQKGQRRPIPPSVPEDLALVIEIATALSPEDRFQSARDMRLGLLRTDTPPDPEVAQDIAAMLRALFHAEFQKTRLPGSPLPF